MTVNDFARYHDLERYLFGEVSGGYQTNRRISAFDFFCIIIWKANRSKSKVAKRMLAQGHRDLQSAVEALISAISAANGNKERLRVLVEGWGFRLPMASAILTVLFPGDFTVYDVRVCDVLDDFKDAQYKTRYDDLWERYSGYVTRVRDSVPSVTALRDKDHYLWGQSFATQLQNDIDAKFGITADDSELEA